MYLREMSKICIDPLRIAFDHIGLKKPYSQAIRYAANYGLTNLSNYMLYNFHDTPDDLYARLRLNIDLNEELGVRIFSFPMRYQPVTLKDRSHIGEHWNRYYLRSIQLILQATHGIASGTPGFFKRAFGENNKEFHDILLRPHHFIFNRRWYEQFDGKAEFEEFQTKFSKLGSSDRGALLGILSSSPPGGWVKAFNNMPRGNMKDLFFHYLPLKPKASRHIWEEMKKYKNIDEKPVLPEDVRIEDAGLNVIA